MADKIVKGQSKLDAYIHKHSKNCYDSSIKQFNDSSHQNFQTDNLGDMRVCSQLILIGPFDIIFSDKVMGKIKEISQHYSKYKLFELIIHNLKMLKFIPKCCSEINLNNLDQIKDQQFWNRTIPSLLELIITKGHLICSCLTVLGAQSNNIIQVTRFQLLLILIAMFLGIIPKQTYDSMTHMGQLMATGVSDSKWDRPTARLQKLKCIVQYFKMITKMRDKWDEKITLHRDFNFDKDYLRHPMQVPLQSVEIGVGLIEDYYGKHIMVDFANCNLGGGVLTNGCVQEEIIFTIFTQCIACKLLIEPIEDQQAVVIYGALRYSKYSGYSNTFTFQGPYQNAIEYNKSIIVAIDAVDYSKLLTSESQYNKSHTRRQIHKAFTGFAATNMQADSSSRIVSGRWGCGAFRGDEYLKFLIQWIAASQAMKQMIYLTTSDQQIDFQILVKYLINLTIVDILNIIDQYCLFRKQEINKHITIMQYIKNYVI